MNESTTPTKNELTDQEFRIYCVEQVVKWRQFSTELNSNGALHLLPLADEASMVYAFIKGFGVYKPENYLGDDSE